MGACSSFSSKKVNKRLKTNEEANKPIIVINTSKATKDITVSKKAIPVKPTNEKTPSKNWNNFKNTITVIPNGINNTKPCKKYFKTLFMLYPSNIFF